MSGDLRVQRTNKLLCDALRDLLCEKSFASIQVTEICERAMVRRATFYKHFSDKYDLFEHMVKEEQLRLRAEGEGRPGPEDSRESLLWCIDRVFTLIERDESIVRHTLADPTDQTLAALIARRVEEDALEGLLAQERQGDAMPASPEVMAAAFTGALSYTAQWWVRRGFEPPRAEVVEQLTDVLVST